MLSKGDAEFLFKKAKNGELEFRVGQVWTIPQRKGMTALLCDYDDTRKINQQGIKNLLAKCGIKVRSIKERTSPSNRGIHAVVWIEGRFSRIHTVALELIIGSDRVRGAEDFRRAYQADKRWGHNWHALFEKKQ